MHGPLSDLKIVEMAGLGPAPFACMLLADLGADIVTIERPGAENARYRVLGRGRKKLSLDLKSAAGVDAVLALVAQADCLVEGFRPGVMERLGLGPEVQPTVTGGLTFFGAPLNTYMTHGACAMVRKLRSGAWVIQDQLDLHGLDRHQAHVALAAFLANCAKRGVRCVRVIHGKGLGSINKEPVLKGKVRAWLVQKEEVIAFCQARPHDGGAGAVVVLLQPATQLRTPLHR